MSAQDQKNSNTKPHPASGSSPSKGTRFQVIAFCLNLALCSFILCLGLYTEPAGSYELSPKEAEAAIETELPEPLYLKLVPSIDPVYSSILLSYREKPIGKVEVVNRGKTGLSDLKLTFAFEREAADFLVVPFTSEIPKLPPESSVEVPILPRLSRAALVRETLEVTAKVRLLHEGRVLKTEKTPVFLYSRNLFDWKSPERICSFINPESPIVTGFVNSVWHYMPCRSENSFPPAQIRNAVGLLTALFTIPFRYKDDPETPFPSKSRINSSDRVNYPSETFVQKTGDCEDFTVLCSAVLEAAGIPTAIGVGPYHVFLLFEAGLPAYRLESMPSDPSTLILWKQRIWFPIETTAFARKSGSFSKAWSAGWRYKQAINKGEVQIVDVEKNWQSYPPTEPLQKKPVHHHSMKTLFNEKEVPLKIEKELSRLRTLFAQNLESKIASIKEKMPEGTARKHATALVYARAGLYDRAKPALIEALFPGKTLDGGINLIRSVADLPPAPERVPLLRDLAICLTLSEGSPQDLSAACMCLRQAIRTLPRDEICPERAELILRLALVYRLRGDLASEQSLKNKAFRAAPFLRGTYRRLIDNKGSRASGEDKKITEFLSRPLFPKR